MRRLFCLFRGHTPIFNLHSAHSNVNGTYLTTCYRCGHLYEQPVTRLAP